MTPPPEVPEALFLDVVRQRRFGGGRPPCKACSHPKCQRWGSFNGRQRYRCPKCLKSFSDLTGSCFEKLRASSKIPAFLQAMAEGLSVRAAAKHCGIAPGTSFRWRHLLLTGPRHRAEGPGIKSRSIQDEALASSHPPRLVTLHPWTFRTSRGSGCWVDASGHQRSGRSHERHLLLSALCRRGPGRGRAAGLWIGAVVEDYLHVSSLERILRSRSGRRATIAVDAGPQAPWRTASVRTQRRFIPMGRWDHSKDSALLRRLRGDWQRARQSAPAFRVWIRRFRGISARWLGSYLGWFLLLFPNPLGGSAPPLHRLGLLGFLSASLDKEMRPLPPTG